MITDCTHINEVYEPSIEKEFKQNPNKDIASNFKSASNWLYNYCTINNYNCYLYILLSSSLYKLSPLYRFKGFSKSEEIKKLIHKDYKIIAEEIHTLSNGYGNINGILECPLKNDMDMFYNLARSNFIFLSKEELDSSKSHKLLEEMFDFSVSTKCNSTDNALIVEILEKYSLILIRIWEEHIDHSVSIEIYGCPV